MFILLYSTPRPQPQFYGAPQIKVAAAATSNSSQGTTRIFLSHWDASGEDSTVSLHPPVNTTVKVFTSRDCRANISYATAFKIDKSCEARKLWVEMGSPRVPTEKQLQLLHDRSVCPTEEVKWSCSGGVWKLSLLLDPNSVLVLEMLEA